MPTKDGKHAYTEEEKAEIIAHVLVNVACGRPVDRIFREDDMTENGIMLCDQSCFWKWVFADPDDEIGGKLARAREYGIEALLDKAIDMAETPMTGESHTIERIKPADMDINDLIDNGPQDRVKTVVGDMTAHRKLYIETMFKAAQMLKPKKYGAKLDLTNSDGKLDMAEQVRRGIQRAREQAAREEENNGE
jgi:hypothetical protein